MGIMEEWAPSWTAEEWDRVGLMTGDPQTETARIWVTLEVNPELLGRALLEGVDMILMHHPPIFRPLKDLRLDRPHAALLQAAARGLALFAAHTNLDRAPGGVNDALADRLNLRNIKPLTPPPEGGLVKLVVTLPPGDQDRVARALFAAGAGRVGAYQECAFLCQGAGRFLAPEDANPHRGRAGAENRVDETRLETVLPAASLGRALAALNRVHPYEEPAVDVYPLRQGPNGFGLGRVGDLPRPMSLDALAAWAGAELDAPAPRLAGPKGLMVERVAVVGGSGGDMLPRAAAAGAQALVTGEAGYHAADQARDLSLGLIVLGHYQTETVVVEPWAARLRHELAQRGFEARIDAYPAGADPWRPPISPRED